MNVSMAHFSPSIRQAGSLESSGRHMKFSNRMSQVINSINDNVYPAGDYYDSRRSDERKPVQWGENSREPVTPKIVSSKKDRFCDDDEEVVTDVTNKYTNNPRPPQPRARTSVGGSVSRSQQLQDEDYEGEEYEPTYHQERPSRLRPKNMNLAPLPDSEIKIKSNKTKMPVHIDERNFHHREDYGERNRPRTSQPDQRLRRQSIESLDSVSNAFSSNQQRSLRNEEDNRSIDTGIDEIEIYPDEQARKSVDPETTKQTFDYPIYKTLVYNTLEYIQTPAPPGCTIKCKLVMQRGVFNEFMLYLEGYSGYDLPIMVTRRRRAVPIIYYFIDAMYIERTPSKNSKTIPFGRLSSNVKRKNFNLVGNRNSNKSTNQSLSGSVLSLNDAPSLDEQLNASSQVINQKKYFDLAFNTKLFGTSKPKEFVVDALINEQAESEHQTRREASSSRLRDSSENFRRVTKRVTLLNKKAEYDPITKKYRLDFNGRAKAPSANNIQLIDESDPKKILFQLGKVKSKCYYLDYSYPLCAFQAFGLAISCLTRN